MYTNKVTKARMKDIDPSWADLLSILSITVCSIFMG